MCSSATWCSTSRGDARQQIRVLPLDGRQRHRLVRRGFPGRGPRRSRPGATRSSTRTALRFTYSSPRRRRRCTTTTWSPGRATCGRSPRCRTTTRRDTSPSGSGRRPADGARVPVSILYRKGLRRDTPHPMLLYAYGSYGSSTDPGFSVRLLPLVDRGYVYAIAHIRGGQEMGRAVVRRRARCCGRRTPSPTSSPPPNISSSEGWTCADRLAIRGGSAGGLLMGAVTNMRPDLFRVVIADVPFVDVINTERDATLEFTTQEWQQWGNPNVPEHSPTCARTRRTTTWSGRRTRRCW